MSLPSSGLITLGAVNTELGLSSTAPITLNDAAVRSLFGKTSGLVTLNDGHGKTYNPGYTWYFPGNGNYYYINNPGNGYFDAQSAGYSSWCIEFWCYPYYTTNNQLTNLVCFGNGGAYGNGIATGWYENQFQFGQGQNPSWSSANGLGSTGSYAQGSWYHYAAVLNSGTVYMYINGVLDTSMSDNSGGSTAGGNGAILNGCWDNRGRGYGGTQCYLYNVRWSQGNPVYTGNFTPQTTPLGTVSGTRLLTCQSFSFVDNSGNGWTLNLNGSSITSQTSPHP